MNLLSAEDRWKKGGESGLNSYNFQAGGLSLKLLLSNRRPKPIVQRLNAQLSECPSVRPGKRMISPQAAKWPTATIGCHLMADCHSSFRGTEKNSTAFIKLEKEGI